jgi:hypothetical protein
MTYDLQSGSVVLVNGRGLASHGSPLKADTWVFSAGHWAQRILPWFFQKPQQRFGAAIASSPGTSSNVTMLVGGAHCPGPSSGQICGGLGLKRIYAYSWNGVDRWSFPQWAPRLNDTTEFPVFVWDNVDRYFVYLTGGVTWRFG